MACPCGGDPLKHKGGFLFRRKFFEHLANGSLCFVESAGFEFGDGLAGPVGDKLVLFLGLGSFDAAAAEFGEFRAGEELLDLSERGGGFMPAKVFDELGGHAFEKREALLTLEFLGVLIFEIHIAASHGPDQKDHKPDEAREDSRGRCGGWRRIDGLADGDEGFVKLLELLLITIAEGFIRGGSDHFRDALAGGLDLFKMRARILVRIQSEDFAGFCESHGRGECGKR